MNKKSLVTMLLAVMWGLSMSVSAQNLFHRADSMLTQKYYKGDIDSAYITRPNTKIERPHLVWVSVTWVSR